MGYQIQAACSHTAIGHMFYHVLCPAQSLTIRVTKVVVVGLLLIGGVFAIYSAIANRFSTPASPKTPEEDEQPISTSPSSDDDEEVEKIASKLPTSFNTSNPVTVPSSPKTLEVDKQARQSISTLPHFKVWVETPESWKHDHNDAHYLDSSMVGKKISDIQDIETVLRLFPQPLSKYKGSKMWEQQNAFSYVSNEILSAFLENPIDDKVYLVDYFSTEQIHVIDIDNVPLSNLKKLFFPDIFPNFSGGYFNSNLYIKFNMNQRKILETKLKTDLKGFPQFKHLQ